MSRIRAIALLTAASCCIAAGAKGHELTCKKTVGGQLVQRVDHYPTTLHFEFTLINDIADKVSVAQTVTDPLLAPYGFAFKPAPPVSVPAGSSVSSTFDVEVGSYEACLRLGGGNEVMNHQALVAIQNSFDNTLHVTFDSGQALCTARVICLPPVQDGGTQDGGTQGTGATRTLGFFKNHEVALQSCLNQGPVNLGFVTITTLPEAEGLLYGNASKFGNGDTRSPLDRDRFILGRQTLVGICNLRLFGTQPSPTTLLSDAVAALSTTNCATIIGLATQVDAYNNSGDANPFPAGFVPGPSTPQDAQSIAVDPTSPSKQVCSK